MDDLPEPVQNRLRRLRGRVGSDAVELAAGAPLDELGSPSAVLVVGWADGTFETAVEWYAALRQHLEGRIAVHVLAPIVEDVEDPAEGFLARMRRRSKASSYRPRHVVGALRESGWTVGDIERIELGDGTRWADIVARDLEIFGR